MADKINVTFIDDDPLVCQLIQKFLTATGKYVVSVFTDSKKGLHHIRSTIPDLTILDIHMPGITGDEMLKKMKQDPLTCHIPIAILTGDDQEQIKEDVISSYAEAFILKPITQEKLDHVLSAILGNVRSPVKVF